MRTGGGNSGALPVGVPEVQGTKKGTAKGSGHRKDECSWARRESQNLSTHEEVHRRNRKNDGLEHEGAR